MDSQHPACRALCSVLLFFGSLAVGCAAKPYNAGDPAGLDFVFMSLLHCVLRDPLCPGPPVIAALSGGAAHTCGISSDGRLFCWGSGVSGQLGHDNLSNIGDGTGPQVAKAGSVPVGGRVTQVTGGANFTCALLDTGAVRCWGAGAAGRLGHDNANPVGDGTGASIIAAGDVPVGATVKQISAGNHHVCAVLTTGALRCWGNGAIGRLGYNAGANIGDGVGFSITAAGDVPGLSGVKQVAGCANHTCAVLDSGAVHCWGKNIAGELGHDNVTYIGDGGTSITAAGPINLGGGTATQVACGFSQSCALLSTGAVRCWGDGANGRLGHDNPTSISSGGITIPTAGDIPLGGTAVSIASRDALVCALLNTGSTRCWGNAPAGNGHGGTADIGDGIGQSIIVAGDIPTGIWATAIHVGTQFVCILGSTNGVRCWGIGASGQLGHDSTSNVGDGAGPTIVNAGDVSILP